MEAHDRLQGVPSSKEEEPEFFDFAKRVSKAGRTLLGRERLYTLWQATGSVRNCEGSYLEVGSYRGGSAWFIASAMKHRGLRAPFHVVDTFAGHPDFVEDADRKFHPPGHFGDTVADEVRDYLKEFSFVQVHESAFEDVVPSLEGQFAFAHLDADTHITTKNGLEFLGDRLSRGGLVVLDDFGAAKCPGVKQAAFEFMSCHDNWRLVRLQTQQAIMIKL